MAVKTPIVLDVGISQLFFFVGNKFVFFNICNFLVNFLLIYRLNKAGYIILRIDT